MFCCNLLTPDARIASGDCTQRRCSSVQSFAGLLPKTKQFRAMVSTGDARRGRGSIFYNPTQPISLQTQPNPTHNWCRHSWPQPNSKHQHNALVVAKHNWKYPKMQKYANHQFRHNHHHHQQQHNLIQWPKCILLQGTLDENSQR